MTKVVRNSTDDEYDARQIRDADEYDAAQEPGVVRAARSERMKKLWSRRTIADLKARGYLSDTDLLL